MLITRNDSLHVKELNELLKQQNWGIESLDKLQRALDLSWGWICVRNDRNDLIGFVQVLSDGIKHAYIVRLLIHPEYRGLGYGKSLMKELLNWLEEEKLNPVLITKPNEESFYNSFGLTRENGGFISLFQWR
ncbi:GNAT family N-acetyltransferase [Gorillibacterium sp. sgz5001074]|uniref:GNAT family N-acetyltransferase n=1 Tax=Gorillibacterium sp. sgz5001074 TaxID=3446695 RepID=UPI003F662CA7